MPKEKQSFYSVIAAAIRDIEEHGFDSLNRIQNWVARIRAAAQSFLIPERVLAGVLNNTLTRVYTNLVEKGGYKVINPGVSRFDVTRLQPKLRGELDRARTVSAQLIKLNREQMIETTERRFSGWASSVPEGGSKVVDKKEEKENVAKALKSLPFEERRVMIDQGAKLSSSINRIIALDNNAIAAEWHSHWREAGYDYRKDHKERDQKVYLIRDSWAHKAGLVKPGPAGYTDEITQPAEEVYCRCKYKYKFNIRGIPEEMLTEKGKKELARVQIT